MRVVLSADMEAISQLRDIRQLLACCEEYWDSGRQAFTDDVVAAAQGLLDAGADEVVLLDNHGSGNPENVIVEQLPAGARAESWNVFDLPAQGVDAMLQVGYHPRARLDGFVPHTYIPGLRLWADDEEISESHGRIWAAQVPLLGITGHAAHQRTLGSLAQTPFLVIQEGTDRTRTEPREATAEIRAFAHEALRAVASAPRPDPPRDVVFRAHLDDTTETQAQTLTAAGWAREGDESFSVNLREWAAARDPLAAAMNAAFEPFMDIVALDVSSRSALTGDTRDRRDALAAAFAASV